MARIPDISAAGTYNTYPWRTVWGPGAIKMTLVTDNAEEIDETNLKGVGLTSGGISFDPGQSSSSRFSDQMYNPNSHRVTGWEYTITTNLDQMDLWNMALAMAYPQSGGVDVGSSSTTLTLSGTAGPAKYKGVELTTEGAGSTAAEQGTKTMKTSLYRCQVVSGGAISYDRETPSTCPIVIHAMGNGTDTVGTIAVDEADISDPGYES